MSNERKMGELWLTTLFSGKNVNVILLLIVRHWERNLDDDICPLLLCAILFDYHCVFRWNESNVNCNMSLFDIFQSNFCVDWQQKVWQFLKNFYTRTCKQRLGTTLNVQRFRMVISNSPWIEYNDLDVPIPNTIETEVQHFQGALRPVFCLCLLRIMK